MERSCNGHAKVMQRSWKGRGKVVERSWKGHLHVVARLHRLRRAHGAAEAAVAAAEPAAIAAGLNLALLLGEAAAGGGLKGGHDRVVQPLHRADLAVHRIARPGELTAHLEGDRAEALRVGPALDGEVVRPRLQLDRRDGDRVDAVVRDGGDELGLPVERDGALEQVDRQPAELVPGGGARETSPS